MQHEYHYADQYPAPLVHGHYGASVNPYIPVATEGTLAYPATHPAEANVRPDQSDQSDQPAASFADTRESDQVSHRAFRTDTISPSTFGQQVRQISFDDAFGAF